MPTRRKTAAQPRSGLTFINSYGNTVDPQKRRKAKRHASYWGHKQSRFRNFDPLSLQPQYPEVIASNEPNEISPYKLDHDSDLWSVHLYTYLPPHGLYFGIEFDTLRCLPEPDCQRHLNVTGLPAVRRIMVDFYGDSFVRNTLLRSGESCSLRYFGCLLICYAYYIAAIGKKYDTFLISLKGEIIRELKKSISSHKDVASFDSMIAVMALGTPIVCQLTEGQPDTAQIPDSLSPISTSPSSPNISDSSDISLSTEYDVHYRAITTLLRMQPDPAYLTQPDGRYIFLVKVISCAHRRLIMRNADHDSWMTLFRKFELYNIDLQPHPCWNSPLFGSPGPFDARSLGTTTERHSLELAQATRAWFQQHKQMRYGTVTQVAVARGRLDGLLAAGELYRNDLTATHESCQIAASLMLASVDRRCSLSAAVAFVPRALKLPSILKKTDLLGLWGSCRGLLYWVTLISHAIARSSQGRNVSTLILAHFTQIFAASQIPLAAALTPIKEMLQYFHPTKRWTSSPSRRSLGREMESPDWSS